MFAGPEYQWVEQQRLLSWIARQWQHLKDWLDQFSQNHPVGYNILLTLLVVALVVLLVHIGYVMWRIVRPAARTGTGASASATGVVMDARAHLALAEELAGAGRYAEALAHCFVAAVLELDHRNLMIWKNLSSTYYLSGNYPATIGTLDVRPTLLACGGRGAA